MPQYRKKPVVISAEKWDGDYEKMDAFLDWHGREKRPAVELQGDALIINTLEGDMRADLGDWIIMGVQGEFYPCKPDIFEQTYEKV
jgi:hypothetical protein